MQLIGSGDGRVIPECRMERARGVALPSSRSSGNNSIRRAWSVDVLWDTIPTSCVQGARQLYKGCPPMGCRSPLCVRVQISFPLSFTSSSHTHPSLTCGWVRALLTRARSQPALNWDLSSYRFQVVSLTGLSSLLSVQEWEVMAGSATEEKTFRRFLELFLREMRPPLKENDPLPMRPLSDLVSEDEVEGECLDLCLQHLYK